MSTAPPTPQMQTDEHSKYDLPLYTPRKSSFIPPSDMHLHIQLCIKCTYTCLKVRPANVLQGSKHALPDKKSPVDRDFHNQCRLISRLLKIRSPCSGVLVARQVLNPHAVSFERRIWATKSPMALTSASSVKLSLAYAVLPWRLHNSITESEAYGR